MSIPALAIHGGCGVPPRGTLSDAQERHARDGLKGALARHLDRFAFREAPLTFDWVDG